MQFMNEILTTHFLDLQKITTIFDPRINLIGEGVVENRHGLCTLVVPLIATGFMHMSVKGRMGGSQRVTILWEPGSLLWRPSRTKMWAVGSKSERMAYLGIGFGDDDTEM